MRLMGGAWSLGPDGSAPGSLHIHGDATFHGQHLVSSVIFERDCRLVLHAAAETLSARHGASQSPARLEVRGSQPVQLDVALDGDILVHPPVASGSTIDVFDAQFGARVEGTRLSARDLALLAGASDSSLNTAGRVTTDQLVSEEDPNRENQSGDLVNCDLDIGTSLSCRRLVNCEGSVAGAVFCEEASLAGMGPNAALRSDGLEVERLEGTNLSIETSLLSATTHILGELRIECERLIAKSCSAASVTAGTIDVSAELEAAAVVTRSGCSAEAITAERITVGGGLSCLELSANSVSVHTTSSGRSELGGLVRGTLLVGPPPDVSRTPADIAFADGFTCAHTHFEAETNLTVSSAEDTYPVSMPAKSGQLRVFSDASTAHLVAQAPPDGGLAGLWVDVEQGIVDIGLDQSVQTWKHVRLSSQPESKLALRARIDHSGEVALERLDVREGSVSLDGDLRVEAGGFGETASAPSDSRSQTPRGEAAGSATRNPAISIGSKATLLNAAGRLSLDRLEGRVVAIGSAPLVITGSRISATANQGQLDGADITQVPFHEIESFRGLHVLKPDIEAIVEFARQRELDEWERQERATRISALSDVILSKPQDGDTRSWILWSQAHLQHRITRHNVEKVLRSIHRLLGYGYRPGPPVVTYVAATVGVALLSLLGECASTCEGDDCLTVCSDSAGDVGRVWMRLAFYPLRLLTGDNPLAHLPAWLQSPTGGLLLGLPFAFAALAVRNFLRSRPGDARTTI